MVESTPTKVSSNIRLSFEKFSNPFVGRGGDGIKSWAAREDNVVDDDIVVWVQFGMNHVPRIEDFPVMSVYDLPFQLIIMLKCLLTDSSLSRPVEILNVALKPVNFFTHNPSIDVPPSRQENNQSQLVSREATAKCCSETSSKL